MSAYIQGASSISPQKTFGDAPFLTEPIEYTGNRLTCVEPDYKDLIDVKSIRRMSHIIRMGAAAGLGCLQDAAIGDPDAMVTGTTYGNLGDTILFLTRIIEQEEDMLSPTAFIQSTHNAVGGQLALLLKCYGYNNTFVHRGLSFESALLDALLLLQEKEAGKILVGSVDEITDASHTILTRFGCYKSSPVSNFALFSSASDGTIAGEGAAFFLLTDKRFPGVYAKLDGLATFFKPANRREIEWQIESFLHSHSVPIDAIDLVITGDNGDHKGDAVYESLRQSVFGHKDVIHYKHLCGEYPTSSSFALWLAANIVKRGSIPARLAYEGLTENRPKRVLIYNHYQYIYHSLMLVSSVDSN
jgi:3-oxoacyl-[acyl-carrier-protein] synthase II